MESFLNRYRNITVLLLVIFAQLLLLAVQVKNDQDVHLIRVWTVTAVTPMARILEGFRGGSIGFVRNYIMLHDADAENRRLKAEVDKLKIENIFLKNELNSAERAQALQVFQAHTPSKMLAATVISNGAGSNSKVVFVDRGSADGVMRGMAVVTPDGIVGKVIAVYPPASEVLLVTDPDFAAGVVSQKSGARGTFKGQGTPLGKIDYVPGDEKVAEGDWFYTSGDDRVFPRGFPVGQVKMVRPGQPFQEIMIEPAGMQRGMEDVLIVVAGVHQEIPDKPPVTQPVYIAPPPPTVAANATQQDGAVPLAPGGTEADKLRQQYKAIGDAQNHKFGEGEPGTLPPDFTKLGQASAAPKPAPAATGPSAPPPAAAASGATGTTGARAPASSSPTGTRPPASPEPPPTTRQTPDVRKQSPSLPITEPPAKRPASDPGKKPTAPGGPLASAHRVAPSGFVGPIAPPPSRSAVSRIAGHASVLVKKIPHSWKKPSTESTVHE